MHVSDYLPAEFATAALSLRHHEGSLYDLLEHEGVRVSAAAAGFRRCADLELAALLDVGSRAPLLFIESVSWDAQLTPFHCYQTWLRSDRITIDYPVTRASSSP